MKYEDTVSAENILNLLISINDSSILEKEDFLPSIELFNNPEGRVDEQTLIGIWKYIDSHAKTQSYPLILGQHDDIALRGLFFSLISQNETVLEALKALAKNIDWMGSSEVWRIEEKGEFTELHYLLDDLKGYPDSIAIKSITSLVTFINKISPIKINIIRTEFKVCMPLYYKSFNSIFSENIIFSSDVNVLVFKTYQLKLTLPTYNPYIRDVLQNKLENNKEKFIKMNSDKINKKIIINLINFFLPKYKANVGTICNHMSISRQTLYRYLKKENTSFKEILNNVRKDRSIELLGVDNISVQKVSQLLGYRELTSFYSAFKKWYGITIKEYRLKISINKNIKI